ncbi:hypothetical protein BpHYR1_047646 [Brachionus plicatilis]|uniref:Uncharacterized protein n=1 Tax=Brachionus plicatilis TaxID=10195 RepID=A0A3M7RY09_BRAPC|nr:hypothetical protein BpHYR1_047646 [Brachionus plicatilis]
MGEIKRNWGCDLLFKKITINYSYNFTNLTLAKSSHTPILVNIKFSMFLSETSGYNSCNKTSQMNFFFNFSADYRWYQKESSEGISLFFSHIYFTLAAFMFLDHSDFRICSADFFMTNSVRIDHFVL